MTIGPSTGASVEATLAFELAEPVVLGLQIAVAPAVPPSRETLAIDLDGMSVEATEVADALGNRVHIVRAKPGRLSIRYAAEVEPFPATEAAVPDPGARLAWLRQSRYCPSDLAEGFVAQELGALRGTPSAARDVGEWIFERLIYEGGASRPGDTAIDTLLSGQGVCRDFAHLTIMICRALGIPTRLVSVYAPGLTPMDFHAVTEVAGPDGWEIIDSTRLAPRQSLVRIATGRDAADTAFVTTLSGYAELVEASVTAVATGDLPLDDHVRPVSIA